MRNSLHHATSNYGRGSQSPFVPGVFEEVTKPTIRTAKQIYASQSKVKPLVDANFWNIFYDRNKLVVVAFWADSCRACADSAAVMSDMANRYFKGPAGPVKFYQVQWDPKVNPRVHRSFGFKSIPVVFFYYTSSGKPPTKAAPLLEGSLGQGDRHDPNRYVHTIEAILRRHAPAKVVPVNQRRGWKHSQELVSKSDFADIDQLLVEPSPFQQYLLQQYRAHPTIRLSRGVIQIQSTFDSTFQRIYGRMPGPDEAGTIDKSTQQLYLRSVNIQLQTFLGNAIHEAIHLFCCPVTGATRTRFHSQYGFGITEGFTEYITEEILKAQKIRLVQPSPYKEETAAVTSLVRVVGVQALADDYFTCTSRVFQKLGQQNYSIFWRLAGDAEAQRSRGSVSGMKDGYRKLKQFLDSI